MLFWFSSVTPEADDYTLNGEEGCRLRILLVSRVVVGNPYKRRYNATDLAEPPCGHHSVSTLVVFLYVSQYSFKVIGEPGGDLNYEETVVYDNDAIRPAFLIVYGDHPEVKSKLHSMIATLFKTPLAS